MKFHNPQNISGASQQNSVLVFSQTTEVVVDLFENNGKKNRKNMTFMLTVAARLKSSWDLCVSGDYADEVQRAIFVFFVLSCFCLQNKAPNGFSCFRRMPPSSSAVKLWKCVVDDAPISLHDSFAKKKEKKLCVHITS